MSKYLKKFLSKKNFIYYVQLSLVSLTYPISFFLVLIMVIKSNLGLVKTPTTN
jgi:hypothetical protein